MKKIKQILGMSMFALLALCGTAQAVTDTIPATQGFDAHALFSQGSATAIANLVHTPRLITDSVYLKMGEVPQLGEFMVASFVATKSFALPSIGASYRALTFYEFQQALAALFSRQSQGEKGSLLVENQLNNVFFVELSSQKKLFITTVFLGKDEDSMWFLDSFSNPDIEFGPGVKVFVKAK